MARLEHRKIRGCFVYLGATLLVVGAFVPVVQHSGAEETWVNFPCRYGSFYDLSKYYAVLGQTCLPGEGVGEFFGLLALSVVAARCFHLRLSRLLRIPFSGAVVWIAFTFWRFVSCMKGIEPPSPFFGAVDLLVAPWGWVAALAGTIILCLESFVRERRRGKTPEQLRRVFK